MVEKLTKKTEQILSILLEADNRDLVMEKKFNDADEKEDALLREAMGELKDRKFISNTWGDGVPCAIMLQGKAYTYFDDIKENIEYKPITNFNINTITTNGSNLVFGDVVNSNLTVDNSYKDIQNKIQELGGMEKEVLTDLLNEAMELIKEVKETRKIPETKGFKERVGNHLEKHGWFYGAIVQLVGTAVLSA